MQFGLWRAAAFVSSPIHLFIYVLTYLYTKWRRCPSRPIYSFVCSSVFLFVCHLGRGAAASGAADGGHYITLSQMFFPVKNSPPIKIILAAGVRGWINTTSALSVTRGGGPDPNRLTRLAFFSKTGINYSWPYPTHEAGNFFWKLADRDPVDRPTWQM